VIPFEGFPKIPRLRREMVITEKIDGSNGLIHIRPNVDDGEHPFEFGVDTQIEVGGVSAFIRAGSRNRWLTHGGKTDNFGFGAWATEHAHELAELGFGSHFGEWWGKGIQRQYEMPNRRFSLFNSTRWGFTEDRQEPPACCDVVPELYRGVFDEAQITLAVNTLRMVGSYAAPHSTAPAEGVIVYLSAAKQLFKVLLENDDQPKGLAA
jgi:hypothetical protein